MRFDAPCIAWGPQPQWRDNPPSPGNLSTAEGGNSAIVVDEIAVWNLQATVYIVSLAPRNAHCKCSNAKTAYITAVYRALKRPKITEYVIGRHSLDYCKWFLITVGSVKKLGSANILHTWTGDGPQRNPKTEHLSEDLEASILARVSPYQFWNYWLHLRSSSSHQLLVPRHKLTFGSRAFRFSAPRVWNSLPVSIRETKSLPTFRRHLNLFPVGPSPFGCPSCLEYLRLCALILLKTLALYKPFTYVLRSTAWFVYIVC